MAFTVRVCCNNHLEMEMDKENPKVEQLHHPEAAAVVDDQSEDKGAGQRALLAQKLKQTWVMAFEGGAAQLTKCTKIELVRVSNRQPDDPCYSKVG